MKLYYSSGACSLASHIVALEAGLSLAYEKVDLRAKKTASGDDFSLINPKGYVPALQLDDGAVLTEGPAIMQYLADQAPGSGLMPASGLDRYRVIEWLGFVSTELHKTFSPLFRPDTPEASKAIAIANLNRRLAFLDGALKDGAYLTGDTFTIADAYAFTILRWSAPMKIDLSGYPNILAYMDRVSNREHVRQALEAEGLLKAA